MNTSLRAFTDASLARRMLELSPAAISVLDRQGRVVFANEKLTQLLGYSSEELMGQSAALFLPGTTICDFETHQERTVSQTVNEPSGESQRILARHKNGAGVSVSLSQHEITGLPEPFLLAYLAKSDSPPADPNQLELERLAAIAQMISGLAHESRNALQRAVACLDLLELDLINNPEQMILSKQIRQSLADLLDNYDEVRRYAEPIVIKPQRVNLMHVCQLAFDELAIESEVIQHERRDRAVRGFPHQLTFSSASQQADVAYVDRDKMKLVFRQLLENAMGAADSIAYIEVDCVPARLSHQEAVNVTTRDHGEGFDDKTLRRAFEPFFTTKLHGTGLGLALCRRIIEAHQGEIRAKNHADGGAVIEVTIPVNAKLR